MFMLSGRTKRAAVVPIVSGQNPELGRGMRVYINHPLPFLFDLSGEHSKPHTNHES